MPVVPVRNNQVWMRVGVGVCIIHLVNGKWVELLWVEGGRAGLPPQKGIENRPIGWDVVRLSSLVHSGWVHIGPVQD